MNDLPAIVIVERVGHDDGTFSYEIHSAAPDWKWLCAFYERDEPNAKAIAEQFARAWNSYHWLGSATEIMQDFVDKVERGEARSVRSYGKMKEWLGQK